MIKDDPGIHLGEIRRRTELAYGTASYHLRVLEQGGYLRVVLDDTKTRFFITEHSPDPGKYGLCDGDREVLETVVLNPGIEQNDLGERLGKSSSRVSRSVGRLANLGHVTRGRNGRAVTVRPRPGGAPAHDASPLSPEGGP